MDLTTKRLVVTATTGCAAILFNGSTLHSWAGVGLGEESVEKLVDKINKSFFKKRNWLNTKTLVIDEVSMMSPVSAGCAAVVPEAMTSQISATVTSAR